MCFAFIVVRSLAVFASVVVCGRLVVDKLYYFVTHSANELRTDKKLVN